MAEVIHLFIATVFLRPYVFIFPAFYLTAAMVAIRWRRTALFTVITWIVLKRYRQWGATHRFISRGVVS